jgi:hypothetical protein
MELDRQVRDIEDRRRAREDQETEAFLRGEVPGDRANRDESEGSSAFSAHLSQPPGDNCRPCSRSAPLRAGARDRRALGVAVEVPDRDRALARVGPLEDGALSTAVRPRPTARIGPDERTPFVIR